MRGTRSGARPVRRGRRHRAAFYGSPRRRTRACQRFAVSRVAVRAPWRQTRVGCPTAVTIPAPPGHRHASEPIRRFRHLVLPAAPWIHAFRGKTFVVAFGGEIVESGQVESLTQDINLLTSLGIRVVIVCGSRPQINAALTMARGLSTEFLRGIRITHPSAMDCVKEAVGACASSSEQRFSFGLPNTPMAQSEGVRLMSGSLLTAQPVGVIDGTDYQFSGTVRDVDAETIHHTRSTTVTSSSSRPSVTRPPAKPST